MDMCEDGQDPYAVDVRQGEPYDATHSKPAIFCVDVADNNGSTSPTFDPASGYCKWTGQDEQPGFAVIYEVCQQPPLDFDALGITSPQMAFVWSWGVAAVLGLWVIGYVIASATTSIRKA